MTLGERLKQIRAHIQGKLAQQGMPTDTETVQGVCMAITCLVRDPDSLLLQMIPMPDEAYAAAADGLARVDLEFAEEVAALRQLVAELERNAGLLADLRQAVPLSEFGSGMGSDAMREMILTLFVYPPDETEGEVVVE